MSSRQGLQVKHSLKDCLREQLIYLFFPSISYILLEYPNTRKLKKSTLSPLEKRKPTAILPLILRDSILTVNRLLLSFPAVLEMMFVSLPKTKQNKLKPHLDYGFHLAISAIPSPSTMGWKGWDHTTAYRYYRLI